MTSTRNTRDTVTEFFNVVRSGNEPDRAAEFFAPEVVAHQVRSGSAVQVVRSPHNYAAHVREMIAAYGDFDFVVDELLVDGDKAYARWTQSGHHVGEIDGYAPTGAPLITTDSAVYRVADGLIVEYWIQPEFSGLEAQLRASTPS